MNGQQQPPKEKRNNGSFLIRDRKVIVNTETGQASVLFEDIASIAWKRKSRRDPNWMLVVIFTVLMLCGNYIIPPRDDDFGKFVFFLLGCSALAGLSMVAKKSEWDDVIVETRGGQLLSYSVDKDKGPAEVEKIENEKRATF